MFQFKKWRVALVGMLVFSISVALQATSGSPMPAPALAQDGAATCDDLVRQAIREIGSSCRELGQNEACYGNTRIDAELTNADLQFAANGDIVGVESLVRLVTQPADPDSGEWGIAVLDIQADLPEAETDSVRLLLFGGVDVEPVAPAGIDPDQPTCNVTNNGTRGVNLRVGPGTEFEVVDSLRPDEATRAYGISADGEWLRTNRGWLAEPFTVNDCDAVALLTIDDASEAYFAPMQNFTLTLTEAGSCESAPDGLLIQAPSDSVANIMINNVELRVGSTAFLTFDRATAEMYIGNFSGDVTVTTNGVGRRLRPGQETVIDMRDAVGDRLPIRPRPFGDKMEAMRDDMLETLPEPVQRPGLVIPNVNGDITLDRGDLVAQSTPSDTPGTWLGCGSCNTCGYAEDECVTSPDGQCLWDPATCRVGGAGALGLAGPASITCTTIYETVVYYVDYNNTGGQTVATTNATSLYGASAVVWTPTQVKVQATCPGTPGTDSVALEVEDSDGVLWGFNTTLVLP